MEMKLSTDWKKLNLYLDNIFDDHFEDEFDEPDKCQILKRKACDESQNTSNKSSKITSTNYGGDVCGASNHNLLTKDQPGKECVVTNLLSNAFCLKRTDSPCSSNKHDSLVKKRKFPGPAGLLPQTKNFENTEVDCLKENNPISFSHDNMKLPKEQEIYSQSTAHGFDVGCWKHMIQDLNEFSDSAQRLLNLNNVRMVLRRATLMGQSIRKVAFIALMIRSMEPAYADMSVVFHDETGLINGIISKDIMDKYKVEISVGSVLLLRDCTLISALPSQATAAKILNSTKKHYLYVSCNALLSIYSIGQSLNVDKTEVVRMDESLIHSLLLSEEKSEQKLGVIENEDCHEQKSKISLQSAVSATNSSLVKGDCGKYFDKMPQFKSPLSNRGKKPPGKNSVIVNNKSTKFDHMNQSSNTPRAFQQTSSSSNLNYQSSHKTVDESHNNIKFKPQSSIDKTVTDQPSNTSESLQQVSYHPSLKNYQSSYKTLDESHNNIKFKPQSSIDKSVTDSRTQFNDDKFFDYEDDELDSILASIDMESLS